MSSIPVTTPEPVRGTNALANTLSIARRNLLHIKSNPEQLVEMTIQPLMFLTLFVFVFGGAIAPDGSWKTYLLFALPGILVQGIAFTPFTTAIGLNVDFQRGLIDRFRSLPISRSSVIAGRITADAVRIVWSIIIICGFGMILGFRFTGGVGGALAGMLITFLFGLTMCWPMAFVGITAKTTESVNTLGFLIILPLTFASSAFVPAASMSGVLKTFVEWNPITAVIDSVRGFMLEGSAPASSLQRALISMVVIVAIFAPLTVAKYRKRA